jgi:sulfur-carrier protein adenylyltransferase/sulfurtransferase
MLSPDEHRRYSRHLLLSEIGLRGQERLAAARVLIVGAGGLGSPAALYLAAAGVGWLGLVDADVVDESNLQRQILHSTPDVGIRKVESAHKRLSALNPHIHLECYDTQLTSQNALEILRSYDIVIDGTDNFATRYLLNDACILLRKPLIFGAVYKFEGQIAVFDARVADKRGSCYRCLFPVPPPAELAPNCAEIGVLGVIPGIIGTLQATEALKLVLGLGEPLVGRMLLVDALSMHFSEIPIPKCKRCRGNEGCTAVSTLIDYEAFCSPPAPPLTQQPVDADAITPVELLHGINQCQFQSQPQWTLVDVREAFERESGFIERSIHIPLGELEARIGELSRDSPTVLYCASGVRSQQALTLLQQRGFTNIRHLAGGFRAWAAASLGAEKSLADVHEKA